MGGKRKRVARTHCIVSLFRELINLTEQRKQLGISFGQLTHDRSQCRVSNGTTAGVHIDTSFFQRGEWDTANVVEVDVSELCLVTLVNDSDVLDLVDAAILAVDATYVNNR